LRRKRKQKPWCNYVVARGVSFNNGQPLRVGEKLDVKECQESGEKSQKRYQI